MSLLCNKGIHTWRCTECGEFKDEVSDELSSKHNFENTENSLSKTVRISSQIWMKENLAVEYYRNGDIIPQVQDAEEWADIKTGAWCYYDNKPENSKLYNWYAVNDKRGLAPEGWHIPTCMELQVLKTSVNNNGNILKAIGQGVDNGTGTNVSGFSALLAGYRYNNGEFYSFTSNTYFWSSEEYDTVLAYYMGLYYFVSNINMYNNSKNCGFSVRCIKDNETV
ncbi:MAG: fibrobacter succinogenes major paralogous domain-containing protein [Ignavibacteria bacterium]